MKAKVFIAWSGNPSRRVAQILHEWLPKVLPYVEAWMSEEDIAKGTLWNKELWENLRKSDFGILCLVPGNVKEPWVIFEAGALAGGKAYDKVSPFLLEIETNILPSPLSQFQCTRLQKRDIKRLVNRINELGGNEKLEKEELKKLFDEHWERLRRRLKAINLTQAAEETEDISKVEVQSTAEIVQLDDLHRKILQILAFSVTKINYVTGIVSKARRTRNLIIIKLKDLVKLGYVDRYVIGITFEDSAFFITEKGIRFLDKEELL